MVEGGGISVMHLLPYNTNQQQVTVCELIDSNGLEALMLLCLHFTLQCICTLLFDGDDDSAR